MSWNIYSDKPIQRLQIKQTLLKNMNADCIEICWAEKKHLFKIGICVWKVKSCLEVDLDTSCHVFKNVGSEEWGNLRYIASCRGKAWLLRQPKQTVKPTWKSSWEVLTEDVHNYTRLTRVCTSRNWYRWAIRGNICGLLIAVCRKWFGPWCIYSSLFIRRLFKMAAILKPHAIDEGENKQKQVFFSFSKSQFLFYFMKEEEIKTVNK